MSKKFPKDTWILIAIRSGYLIVSEDGTIRRANKADDKGVVDRSKGYSVVTQQVHKKSGRVYFNMTYVGYTKSVLVNRVVALRFHPNPLNLPQVNHIDGNKENNAASNLEWSTGSDNEKHAHRTGLKTGRGSANSNAKLTADQVMKIRAAANDNTPEELAKTYGVSRSTVINIINGKTWKHV
ncbi:HNH endonuclease [Rhizobium sp. AN5]|uniref:HNH endonuclease n=1 Tax=Rhizobium sp. AN5 TaxID=1855304 RepID=UPI000BCA508D|nr:HNH endonuclease [Rhizobium sp. AN5]SOC90080.1 HNH endonuclease [Rhizobium sp. AN5]